MARKEVGKEMPKVSVIIPVYNSEQYICNCLDSVLNQTLSNIEIICIDDCSTDCSKGLLEKYAKTDERIIILNNDKNRGQSFSRNKAIDIAVGEYIQFLDSDDYLSDEDVLESLYSVAVENRLDLLKNGWLIKENDVVRKGISYPESIVGSVCSGRELLYRFEFNNVRARITTSNFVKLGFLKNNKISFHNDIIYEDILYSYELFYHAERAMCVNQYTYFYVTHAGSTTTKRKDINHLNGLLACVNEILKKDFKDSSIEFKYASVKYLIRMYRDVMNIRKDLNYSVKTEMLDDAVRIMYEILWERKPTFFVNTEAVVQNINRMAQNDKIYIYGAGNAARELLDILGEHDIAIDGVFVTNTKNSVKTLLGHKVMGIETFESNDNNVLFLVAITEKYIGNTINLLRSKGIENIIYVC